MTQTPTEQNAITVPVTWTRTLKILWSWGWRTIVYVLTFGLILYSVAMLVNAAYLHFSKAPETSAFKWIPAFVNSIYLMFYNLVTEHQKPELSGLLRRCLGILILIPFEIYALKRVFRIRYKDFQLGFDPEVSPETRQYKRNFLIVWFCLWVPETIISLLSNFLPYFEEIGYIDFLKDIVFLFISVAILKYVLTKGYGTVCLRQPPD